jgi:predicted Rossmann-fold nucleotide-binding protein
MDEMFEALTLVQTRKVTRFPVVLLGTAYWSGLIGWLRETMLGDGYVGAGDLDLISLTDDVGEAVRIVLDSDAALKQEQSPGTGGHRDRPVEG